MVVTSHGELPGGHRTGLWLEEYAVPYNEFVRAGFDVVTASPNGGAAPIDPRSDTNEPGADASANAREQLAHTQSLDGIDPSGFDAIFFPGGHGTMFDTATDPRVKSLVRDFTQAGKVVAAVCHGPAAFAGATTSSGKPIVAGKKLTAFTDAEEREIALDKIVPFLLEERLRQEGAGVEVAPNWSDHVVVDGTLVTGQNPQSSASTARATIAALAKTSNA